MALVLPISSLAVASTSSCPDSQLVPAQNNLPRVEAAVLCLINQERDATGVVPLRRSPQLDRSATYHAAEMVRLHFLAHHAPGTPTLLARLRGFGYFNGVSQGVYGENVGAGPSSNGTAESLLKAWIASPEHRLNLVFREYRDIGIAAVLAPPDPAFFADFPSTVYATDFGRRYVRAKCSNRTPSVSPRRGERRYCARRR
jgi:uncharacterized protein YkwD